MPAPNTSMRRPRGQEQQQEEGAGRPATRMERALPRPRTQPQAHGRQADSSTSSRDARSGVPSSRATYHAKGPQRLGRWGQAAGAGGASGARRALPAGLPARAAAPPRPESAPAPAPDGVEARSRSRTGSPLCGSRGIQMRSLATGCLRRKRRCRLTRGSAGAHTDRLGIRGTVWYLGMRV